MAEVDPEQELSESKVVPFLLPSFSLKVTKFYIFNFCPASK